jgi:membrane protein DedA with SNARE-associated domain
MEEMFHSLTNFVRDHQQWAAPIVFALAFAESLAFLSLIIPAWGALVAIGALMGAAGGSFWPIWIAGALGAAFGDWLSFWIGTRFHDRIGGWWPMSKYPDMLPRAEAFMKKWGVVGIVFARFSGPLRATAPLVAGVVQMPLLPFQLANFGSAFLWAAMLLAPGMFGVKMMF